MLLNLFKEVVKLVMKQWKSTWMKCSWRYSSTCLMHEWYTIERRFSLQSDYRSWIMRPQWLFLNSDGFFDSYVLIHVYPQLGKMEVDLEDFLNVLVSKCRYIIWSSEIKYYIDNYFQFITSNFLFYFLPFIYIASFYLFIYLFRGLMLPFILFSNIECLM